MRMAFTDYLADLCIIYDPDDHVIGQGDSIENNNKYCVLPKSLPPHLHGNDLIKYFYDYAIDHMLNNEEFNESKDEVKKLYDMPHLYGPLVGEIKIKIPNGVILCRYLSEFHELNCKIEWSGKLCVVKFDDIYGEWALKLKKTFSADTNKSGINFNLFGKCIEINFGEKTAFYINEKKNVYYPDFKFKFYEGTDNFEDLPEPMPIKVINPNLSLLTYTPTKHTKAYWKIVERIEDHGDADSVRENLGTLKPQQLADFHLVAEHFMDLLNSDEFAQNLPNFGNSDDMFSYVRGTVVLTSEEKFRAILAKPELIAEFDQEDTPLVESLEYMAEEVALEILEISEEKWEAYLEKSKVEFPQ